MFKYNNNEILTHTKQILLRMTNQWTDNGQTDILYVHIYEQQIDMCT